MDTKDAVATLLEKVLADPARQSDADLSKQLSQAISMLRNGTVAEPEGGVMTTGEAAKALGIRSINTIKRWAGDGILEGFRRGGRIVISRRSVEAMLRRPELARQKDWERELDEVLAPFDVGDQEVPFMGGAHIGRKPWDNVESRKR